MAPEKMTIDVLISGKVQGVFMRADTKKKADTLGVTGWVKNLVDGRVQVMATGNQEQLSAFEKFLWQGSPQAQVDQVNLQKIGLQEFPEFSIRR